VTVNRAAQHANNKDVWETPPDVFQTISDAFGGFDLDVAASDTNHLCDHYFTEQNSALAQEWLCRQWWCNPPFSLKEEFLRKAIEQLALGHQGVMLLPSSQEAGWFRQYITHPRRKRATWPGRIQFLINGERPKRAVDIQNGGSKLVTSGNTGGSVIIAFTLPECILPPDLAGEPWVS
jgi:phage N-6-adenine-methyltransferase